MLRQMRGSIDDQTDLKRILFCLYDDASYRVFESALTSL